MLDENKDESYCLLKQIEKQKKKILRDQIEDEENKENERFASEQTEVYKIHFRPKLF